MEKGAIRKLAEPQAQAELPPTKDGFYHFSADITEYELPGAAVNALPQNLHHYGPAGGPSRDIDEQKFLLSDEEMAELRAQKARIRKQQAAQPPMRTTAHDEYEAYEMMEPYAPYGSR